MSNLKTRSEYTSRRIISRVVNDYDLFSVNGDGLVCVCVRERAPASVRADVRASVRASVRAGEPIVSKEIENKEREKETSVGSVVVEDDRFQKYSNEPWFPRIHELLSPDNLIWREPLKSKNKGTIYYLTDT